LSTTNPTWSGLGTNVDCHDERPVSDCLNLGMVPPLCTLLLINLSFFVLLLDLQKIRWEQGGMDWIDLAQDSDKWWALVNVVKNLWVV
jgi:hypothetical protein